MPSRMLCIARISVPWAWHSQSPGSADHRVKPARTIARAGRVAFRNAAPARQYNPAIPERRQPTVLQSRRSGLRFLAAKRNLEDLHTVLTAVHGRCARIIREAGGTVAQP